VGLTQYTNKSHIARAVLEAVCFQTREVLDAMKKDSGVTLKELKVDGGMTKSDLVLQIQADLAGIPVMKPQNSETTVLGAAYAAGIATGVWTEQSLPTLGNTQYLPKIDDEARENRLKSWKKAVDRSLNWVEDDK
jgi:glycerol kinase